MNEPMMACPNTACVGGWYNANGIMKLCNVCYAIDNGHPGRVPMPPNQQMVFLAERFGGLRVWCPCKGVLRCADGYMFVSGCPGDEFPHDHTLVTHNACQGRGWNPVSPRDVLAIIAVLEAGEFPRFTVNRRYKKWEVQWAGFKNPEHRAHDLLPAAAVLAIQETAAEST